MKSVDQMLENNVHKFVRRKVRNCTQPSTIENIIYAEMNSLLSEILDNKLKEEQAEYLNRGPYERNGDWRKRNGYKEVRLRGIYNRIVIRKPVLRTATPKSRIIELFKKFGRNMIGMIASCFWLRGASTRATCEELNKIFGTKLHPSDISDFTNKLIPDIMAYLEKPITDSFEYIFLDAIYIPFKNKDITQKSALLCAIGLSLNGNKSVLGFLLGDRESKDSWSCFIKDLIKRGLNINAIKLVISDDHKAIINAVSETLNKPHQLCLTHKMRNALARIRNKEHKKAFLNDFKAVYWHSTSKEEAIRMLGQLEQKWSYLYPKAVQITINNFNQFLLFMEHPQKIWKSIRTTNIIERFNYELKRRLNAAGTMLSEYELFKLIATVSQYQELRWKKKLSRLSYKLSFNPKEVA